MRIIFREKIIYLDIIYVSKEWRKRLNVKNNFGPIR